MNMSISFTEDHKRHCGGCTLCCKLLPVRELAKPAGERCKHQRIGRGCAVYGQNAMPPACKLWSCRWLTGDDTTDISRPDRAHFVIDIMPDYITMRDNETGACTHIQVVQVWIDPRHPEVHRDPALRRYMERRAQEGIATIVRANSSDAIVILAPPFASDGQWHEITSGVREASHTPEELLRALS